jgi:arginyl-tRNA synthetase
MADPLRALAHAFQAALGKVFGANEAATDSLIHRSAHADYQVDVAMALAKRMGRPPREVAASISTPATSAPSSKWPGPASSMSVCVMIFSPRI